MELISIRSARTVVAAVTWLAALGCPVSSVFADTPSQLQNITENWKGTLSSTAWKTAADIQLVLYQSDQELRGRLYCDLQWVRGRPPDHGQSQLSRWSSLRLNRHTRRNGNERSVLLS
ncbi:MAG: hypothetical protein CV089_05645 [Nitrospira sp. WS110]|nr:hypothetical protein [Nitrospira sp. WS110]